MEAEGRCGRHSHVVYTFKKRILGKNAAQALKKTFMYRF